MNLRHQFDLAASLHRANRLEEAQTIYHQVLLANPKHPEVLNLLGLIAIERGDYDEAIELIGQAIRIKPDYADAHSNLGNSLYRKGQLDEAVAAYQRAIKLNPKHGIAHCNLSAALKDSGRLDDAIASANRAIQINPNSAKAYNNLGNAQERKGQYDDAIVSYKHAIQLNPNSAVAPGNLGALQAKQGRMDESAELLQRAIQLNPKSAKTYGQLGNTLRDTGQLEQAITTYRRAIELRLGDSALHSKLLYALHFAPSHDARTIYEEHRLWNQKHAEPLRKLIQPHRNNVDPHRSLRIGYVSPDFTFHPVGRFIHPLLAAHDRDQFIVHCYSDVHRPDGWTDRIRASASQWRSIVGLSDDAVAQSIREDQIDVLVDLTMHMPDNRMNLFARKPAPVQVTYLAYCSTTGLATMDFRLTDPHLDPPQVDGSSYSEKSVHLPETYWCYQLDGPVPDVNPLPLKKVGYVTFGCLNNFCKTSPVAIETWTQVMQAVPQSRFIIHALEGSHRQRMSEQFQSRGIDPQRLRFLGRIPFLEFLRIHHEIDIALDSFPYNGGTTTCDAMWMGVPVITLAGPTAFGRSGVSLLRNVGLPDLIAESPQQLVQIAHNLAGDVQRLVDLRQTMRDRMRASVLMDSHRFAGNVESAYRRMWEDWCRQ